MFPFHVHSLFYIGKLDDLQTTLFASKVQTGTGKQACTHSSFSF